MSTRSLSLLAELGEVVEFVVDVLHPVRQEFVGLLPQSVRLVPIQCPKSGYRRSLPTHPTIDERI